MDNVNPRLTKLFGPSSALRVTSAPGRERPSRSAFRRDAGGGTMRSP